MPTPLPPLAAARNPEGLLVYRGNSFQSRSIDRRGGVAQDARGLDFQPPAGVEPGDDYLAHFDQLVPAPRGGYAVAIAEVESGEIVDIVDLQTERSRSLYWRNAEGEPVSAGGFFYGWHPNGYEFLFREDNAPDRGLWLVDARTGEHRLIAWQPTLDISGAAISPDGQRLVYATNTFDVHQVWTANADGSEPRLLLESDAVVYVYSWSPDGSLLAVSRMDEQGQVDIWLVGRGGRGLRRVTDAPEVDRRPAWMGEGTR
jgi:Tol biopolymer transport system component